MAQSIIAFLARFGRAIYLLRYYQKSPFKLLKFIKKNHSLYRTDSFKELVLKIERESESSNVSFCETTINKHQQSLKEKEGINYKYWVEHIEHRLTPNIQPIVNDTLVLFFIITRNISPRQLSVSIESLQKQTCNSWRLVVITNNKASICHHIEASHNELTLCEANNIQHTTKIIRQLVLQQQSDCYINIIPQGCQLNRQTVQHLLKYDTDIVYSDEDQLDFNNIRINPHFKPAWNPDYFYSYDYLSHTTTLRGGFFSTLTSHSKRFDENFYTLYRLLLHNKEKLDGATVKHIPAVLFHIPSSLKLRSPRRSIFHLPKQPPKVSIIIPTRDELDTLKTCINSILNNTYYQNIELIIVNNRSKQKDTLNYLKSLDNKPLIRVLDYHDTFNYSAINNFAVKHAKGTLLAFVNNDIECINSEWLTEMVSHACRDDIGCVGAKLYYPDGTIQHGGVILGIKGTASHAHKGFAGNSSGYFERLSVVHNVSAVTAACMVMRKALFVEAGGFDETNLTIAYNDVDLCLKVRELGYRNLWTPFAELIHYESKSRGKKHTKEARIRLDKEEAFMKKKWMKYLKDDPAYNINLTLIREDFSLGNSRKEG